MRDIALARGDSDFKRYVPVRYQISLEAALSEAEQSKRHFEQGFARRGGRAEKSDALQDFILAALRANPDITAPELLDKLKSAAQPGGPIEDVDDEVIAYVDEKAKGRSGSQRSGRPIRKGKGGRAPREKVGRSAPVSGLNDRLSRARKKIEIDRLKSRLPDSAIGLLQAPGG